MNKNNKLKLYENNKNMLVLIFNFGGIMSLVNLRDICLRLKYYKNKTSFYNSVSKLTNSGLISKSNNYIYLLKFTLALVKGADIKEVKSVNIRVSKSTLDLLILKEKTFLYIINNRDTVNFKEDNCSFLSKNIDYLNNISHICDPKGFSRELEIYNNNKAYKCSYLNNNSNIDKPVCYNSEASFINILRDNKKVVIRRIKDFNTKVRLTVMILDYNNTLTNSLLNKFILLFNLASTELFGANRFSPDLVTFVIIKNCIKYKELKTNFHVKYLNLYKE